LGSKSKPIPLMCMDPRSPSLTSIREVSASCQSRLPACGHFYHGMASIPSLPAPRRLKGSAQEKLLSQYSCLAGPALWISFLSLNDCAIPFKTWNSMRQHQSYLRWLKGLECRGSHSNRNKAWWYDLVSGRFRAYSIGQGYVDISACWSCVEEKTSW
jgi:hypothetical protein